MLRPSFHFKLGSFAVKKEVHGANEQPCLMLKTLPSGMYYKLIMIVNVNSSVVNKLETSIIDDTSVVIYDHHMYILQATGFILLA